MEKTHKLMSFDLSFTFNEYVEFKRFKELQKDPLFKDISRQWGEALEREKVLE